MSPSLTQVQSFDIYLAETVFVHLNAILNVLLTCHTCEFISSFTTNESLKKNTIVMIEYTSHAHDTFKIIFYYTWKNCLWLFHLISLSLF